VRGSVSPLKLNPAPLALAAEIVRLDPPELLSVPLSDFDVPTWTFPKLKLVGLETNWPCARPVPESGTERVGLPASELIVSVPLAAPAAVGANITLNVALCPAVIVAGRLGPVKLNPLPLADALETVTLTPPVLVIVTGTVLLVPTVTFPKLTLLGFAVSEPAARPVPDNEMLSGELDPSDTMATEPLTAPALAGIKFTVKVTLWFAFRVTGRLSPLIEKPAPLAVACEMLTADPPVLVRVSDLLLVAPTTMLPNDKLEGFGDNVPWATPSPVNLTTTLLFC